jgi:hypothetical protein
VLYLENLRTRQRIASATSRLAFADVRPNKDRIEVASASASLTRSRLLSGETRAISTAAFSKVARSRASLSARARLASTCSVITSANSNAPPVRLLILRQGFNDRRTQKMRPSCRGKRPRRFRESVGLSPADWPRERMCRAHELLEACR